MATLFESDPIVYCNRAAELKSILETAKLNNITIDDSVFNKIFSTLYEKETTKETKTQTEIKTEKS